MCIRDRLIKIDFVPQAIEQRVEGTARERGLLSLWDGGVECSPRGHGRKDPVGPRAVPAVEVAREGDILGYEPKVQG